MVEPIGLMAADEGLAGALREALRRIPKASRSRFVDLNNGSQRRTDLELARLLFISWAGDLSTELASSVEDVRRGWEGYLVFVDRGTPVEALGQVLRLRVQDPCRLQFVTAADEDQARSHVLSFIERLSHHHDSEGILHGWWASDSLELLTTAFRRISVPHASIIPLADAAPEQCAKLEVSYDGTFLTWPSLDVHLGFDPIEELVAPEHTLRRRQKSDNFNRRYGAAIRSVRLACGLKQTAIKSLSPRHVGRIERGETRATGNALRHLARAHGLSDAEYLARIADALEAA